MIHLAHYGGWPVAVSALRIIEDVYNRPPGRRPGRYRDPPGIGARGPRRRPGRRGPSRPSPTGSGRPGPAGAPDPRRTGGFPAARAFAGRAPIPSPIPAPPDWR